jgi:hypothetical protein
MASIIVLCITLFCLGLWSLLGLFGTAYTLYMFVCYFGTCDRNLTVRGNAERDVDYIGAY